MCGGMGVCVCSMCVGVCALVCVGVCVCVCECVGIFNTFIFPCMLHCHGVILHALFTVLHVFSSCTLYI